MADVGPAGPSAVVGLPLRQRMTRRDAPVADRDPTRTGARAGYRCRGGIAGPSSMRCSTTGCTNWRAITRSSVQV